MTGKTGGMGTAWVDLPPKPARVADHYAYWGDPPPERSDRCAYWVEQLERGWMPNKFIRREGYDTATEWFGVYIWEYLNVISPMISERARALRSEGSGLRLFTSCLFSKWGFNDGDAPEELLDICDAREIAYPDDWHGTLRILVHTRLLPLLTDHVEVYDIETNHNPIRAKAVNGVPVPENVMRGSDDPPDLQPDGVLIPWDEVLAVAGARLVSAQDTPSIEQTAS